MYYSFLVVILSFIELIVLLSVTNSLPLTVINPLPLKYHAHFWKMHMIYAILRWNPKKKMLIYRESMRWTFIGILVRISITLIMSFLPWYKIIFGEDVDLRPGNMNQVAQTYMGIMVFTFSIYLYIYIFFFFKLIFALLCLTILRHFFFFFCAIVFNYAKT